MRTPKVLINFKPYSDPALATFAQTIVTCMTGNAHFTTPVPALTVLSTAITAFNAAITAASSGNHADMELKDQKRKALDVVLHQLALYVEAQSAGDAAIMMSAGFKTSKDPAPVGPLPKPIGFQVLPKGKGEMKLALDKVNGASSYQFEYKQVAATEWIQKTSTKAKILLLGLESGKEYNFRIVPIGTSDVREYSDEISSFVL